MEQVLRRLRALGYVSTVRLVGSYAKGKRRPKDIDVAIKLRIREATLRKHLRKIKGDILRIIRESSYRIPFDVYIITSDRKKWRLRPWEDIVTQRRSYEWE